MTRIRIEGVDGRSSITVDGPSEPAQALEGVALDVLVRGMEKEGGDAKAREALLSSGNSFIAGVLAGLYAEDRDKSALVPVFRVLMTLYELAKQGLGVEDEGGDEEFKIVKEEDRCP